MVQHNVESPKPWKAAPGKFGWCVCTLDVSARVCHSLVVAHVKSGRSKLFALPRWSVEHLPIITVLTLVTRFAGMRASIEIWSVCLWWKSTTASEMRPIGRASVPSHVVWLTARCSGKYHWRAKTTLTNSPNVQALRPARCLHFSPSMNVIESSEKKEQWIAHVILIVLLLLKEAQRQCSKRSQWNYWRVDFNSTCLWRVLVCVSFSCRRSQYNTAQLCVWRWIRKTSLSFVLSRSCICLLPFWHVDTKWHRCIVRLHKSEESWAAGWSSFVL